MKKEWLSDKEFAVELRMSLKSKQRVFSPSLLRLDT